MCGLSVDTRHYKVKYAFLVMSRFTKNVFISDNATIKKNCRHPQGYNNIENRLAVISILVLIKGGHISCMNLANNKVLHTSDAQVRDLEFLIY